MKFPKLLGGYGWNGRPAVRGLSAREEEAELAEAWERYLACTLEQQRQERELQNANKPLSHPAEANLPDD